MSKFQEKQGIFQIIPQTTTNIDPNYISGLIHADGSFFVSLQKDPKAKYGVRFRPRFSLTLDKNSRETLETVNNYFNKCGNIVINKNRHAAELIVSSSTMFEKYIIPHFLEYPLFGKKLQALNGFVSIIASLKIEEHHNYDNFLKLIQQSISLNLTGTSYIKKKTKWEEILGVKLEKNLEELPESFLKWSPKNQQEQIGRKFNCNDQFIIGLIDGDGCFNINFKANAKITFEFQIVGDTTQRGLLGQIKEKFNCGSIQGEGSVNIFKYKITGRKDIINNIIPFMEKNNHKLHTEKRKHYEIFKKIILKEPTIVRKEFLTIVEEAYNMNLGGKRRKLTKEEYLEKYAQDIKNYDDC